MNLIRECPICKEMFVPVSNNRKYCSLKCAQKAASDKQNHKLMEIRRKIREEELAKDKICKCCGVTYHSANARSVFCSPDCKYKKDKELNKLKRQQAKLSGEVIRPPKKRKKKTDWKKVVKICDDNHLSYGEAVVRGLFD